MVTHIYHKHQAKIKGWHTICGQRDSIIDRIFLRTLLAKALYNKGRLCGECLALGVTQTMCILCKESHE